MTDALKSFWTGLEPRERWVLGLGTVLVVAILLYALLIEPFYRALSFMQGSVSNLRSDLVWVQQQRDLIRSDGGLSSSGGKRQGADASLVSVLDQTAKRAGVRQAIQQIVPNADGRQAQVVLENADFNRWVRWLDDLYRNYGVDISQMSAERDDDKANIGEMRVTFIRD